MNTESLIIDNKDYKFKIKKTWVPTTECWHLQFFTQSIYDYRFEVFLTDNELKLFKEQL